MSPSLARACVTFCEIMRVNAFRLSSPFFKGGRCTDDSLLLHASDALATALHNTNAILCNMYDHGLVLKRDEIMDEHGHFDFFDFVGRTVDGNFETFVKNPNTAALLKSGPRKIRRYTDRRSARCDAEFQGIYTGELLRAERTASNKIYLLFSLMLATAEFMRLGYSPETLRKGHAKAAAKAKFFPLPPFRILHALASNLIAIKW